MPKEYCGCWKRTFDDLRNTESASEQTWGSKENSTLTWDDPPLLPRVAHAEGTTAALLLFHVLVDSQT